MQMRNWRIRLRAETLMYPLLAFAFLHLVTISVVFGVLTHRGEQPHLRALLGMMLGVYSLWIVGCGLLEWRLAPFVRSRFESAQTWRLRFFGLCVVMSMIEEAVTTLMTNLAPWFGVRVGEIYITASSNYWDVILGHSLIVITPTFLAWTWLLGRYQFRPAEVLLLFGVTGTIMEKMSGGPAQAPMWILVYGLMVFLPACSVPAQRAGIAPRFKHYVAAVLVPFLFMPLCIPFVYGIRAIRPSAAREFPPMVLPK